MGEEAVANKTAEEMRATQRVIYKALIVMVIILTIFFLMVMAAIYVWNFDRDTNFDKRKKLESKIIREYAEYCQQLAQDDDQGSSSNRESKVYQQRNGGEE